MSSTTQCDRTIDAGPYTLGILDDAELEGFETHLLSCPRCASEVAELSGLPDVLNRLDLEDVLHADSPPQAPHGLFERLTDAIDTDSRASRRRRVFLAAAAGIAVAGVATGLALSLGGSSVPSYSAASGAVHMGVALDASAAGTELTVDVAGLPHEEHCRLIAIGTDGSRHAAGTWTASYDGAATITTSTSLPPSRIADLVLFGTGGRRLVTVATSSA
jgi:hypothetical protein